MIRPELSEPRKNVILYAAWHIAADVWASRGTRKENMSCASNVETLADGGF